MNFLKKIFKTKPQEEKETWEQWSARTTREENDPEYAKRELEERPFHEIWVH